MNLITVTAALKAPALRRLWPWIWSALPVIVLLEAQAVAPVGHWSLLFLELPYELGLLAAVGVLLVAPFLMLRRTTRVRAIAWLIAAIIYLPLAIGALLVGDRIRQWAFDRLAVRSAPLVSAIRNYAEARGAPPSLLSDLVPDYLPRIPSTGMMAYPRYQYYAGTNAHRYNGNPWVLVIHTPGGMDFDQFMYFPLQNYPTHGYGGLLARVRDWAYVHE